MIKTWLRFGGMASLAAAATFGLTLSATAKTVVLSNSTGSGDTITGPSADVAIGASNWSYFGVDAGGTTGVNTNIQDKDGGNGSVYLATANSTGSAYVIYDTGSSLGLLKDVKNLSYQWYRTVASTVPQHLAPAMFVKVQSGSNVGYLAWENVYNGGSTSTPVPTNDWQTANAYNSGAGTFWATNSLYANGSNTFKTFNEWLTMLDSNASVLAIAVGVGSGWEPGAFAGAVDNIAFGFNGDGTTYDFEVKAVPEPGSVVMGLIAGGLGLAGAAWRRRRVG